MPIVFEKETRQPKIMEEKDTLRTPKKHGIRFTRTVGKDGKVRYGCVAPKATEPVGRMVFTNMGPNPKTGRPKYGIRVTNPGEDPEFVTPEGLAIQATPVVSLESSVPLTEGKPSSPKEVDLDTMFNEKSNFEDGDDVDSQDTDSDDESDFPGPSQEVGESGTGRDLRRPTAGGNDHSRRRGRTPKAVRPGLRNKRS